MRVKHPASDVYKAINNVRGWWSEEIQGITDREGEVYFYHHQDIHRCHIRVEELVPNKKVIWYVVDNYFNFTRDEAEWKDTRIVFDIVEDDNRTVLHFTHEGLVPKQECYAICAECWDNYLQGSLRKLIETGKGEPNAKEGNEFQHEIDKRIA